MKKQILFAIIMASSVLAFAQTDSISKAVKAKSAAIGHSGNNEIRVNLLYSVLGIPELTYERLIEDNMGVGISVAVNLTDDNVYGTRLSSLITPHYRLYFGAKKANGFFIEGNAVVISYKDYDYSRLAYESYPNNFNFSAFNKNFTKFGLGVAGGAKFLTRNGFLGEAYLGLGRVFGSNSVDAYGRVGLSIGKRF